MIYRTEFLRYGEAKQQASFQWPEGTEDLEKLLKFENPYIVRVRKPYYPGCSEINDSDRIKAISRTFNKLSNYLTFTSEYYLPLIALFKKQEGLLMDSLEETIKRQYEDSANGQSTNSRGESEAPTSATFEEFDTSDSDSLSFAEKQKGSQSDTSQGTSTETRTHDSQYAIDKLNNIRQKWVSLLGEWYKDLYDKFVVAEAQIWE